MRDLEGKVAVVTGAASGMGGAVSDRFARAGMRVVLADYEAAALERAVNELKEEGFEAVGVHTDVSDAESVEALARQTLAAFGGAHIVCNNAGVYLGGEMRDATFDDWRFVLSVNLDGVFHVGQRFAKLLREQGRGGHIVNTASVAGQICFSNMGPYNVAKFGVVALSETLADEVAGTGVGVSCLCPGFVATRIAESARNRPESLSIGLAEPTAEEEALREAMVEVFAAQKPPAEVAELVLNAIRENQFWIFTDQVFQERMAARHAGIMGGKDRPHMGELGEVLFEGR